VGSLVGRAVCCLLYRFNVLPIYLTIDDMAFVDAE
jgi:hypothetical protein